MSGRNKRGRDLVGVGLAALTRLSGAGVIDKLNLRPRLQRAVYVGAKGGFRTVNAVGAVSKRSFAKVPNQGPAERPTRVERDLFDLTLTDEQQLIVGATREFAAEQVRPAAAGGDVEGSTPAELLKRAGADLGVTIVGVPEALGGLGHERSATTSALVAEALAHGDLSIAVACLAPAAVSTALTLWGDPSQQATYLPSFVGDDAPAAALAISEPRPLFDPFVLAAKAVRRGDDYVLDGVKSLVPRAAMGQLFVVAAALDGRPALFIVEAGAKGVSVETEPAMGLRAASTGRLILQDVLVSGRDRLGNDRDYADCVRLGRIAWAALATGTGQAVLDYVIPYVNERQAFGEPLSHRQAVAFMVSDIAIELEGIRLTMLRAAARAEQGKPFAREAALARRLSAEYGMKIGSAGVQLLGGHGYVKDHPVERWYRDLRAVGVMEGVVLV